MRTGQFRLSNLQAYPGSSVIRCYSFTCIRLFGGEPLHEGVEVFQARVFDDHFAAAVAVFDCDFEAEGTLQAFLGVANIYVDGRWRLGGLFRLLAGVDELVD